jgi:hypothetical protein
MASINSCISVIFGAEGVIKLFIEINRSIDERGKNLICIVDKATFI